ncbi:hypothetical protein BIZ78_gp047 [Erwinia phage vB_EamM_Caitlin]|uniref:hypothetical protein n=1 Tax=Erwinia phage vB_EamM_Caitlin TaxID=1883379 RepID=UPI00081C4A0F|nr:hypothetical protein BIZ78_gp047 [Erwinia phage vB_EamM_Caitlin]ANZ48528.1 hypothetical protein CAITLIN_233 [Erwinia phage vB_EamM_Caitlin]
MSQSEEEDVKVAYQAFDGDVDDEESLLRQTQQARIKISNDLMQVPQMHLDSKLVSSLVKMLDGVDKQVLGKRRAEAADKSAGAQQDVANALNNWVRDKRGARIERHDGPPDGQNSGYQPAVPHIPDGEHGEGELAPVGEKIDVELIMKTAFAQRPVGDEDDEY